jgi:hypothetical protein
MKLWKKVNGKEWELTYEEIADRFIKSEYNASYLLDREAALALFIESKDGLNSVWTKSILDKVIWLLRSIHILGLIGVLLMLIFPNPLRPVMDVLKKRIKELKR